MNWLRLHVSNVCNFKCPNCHVFEMAENINPSQLMDDEIFIQSIKQVSDYLILRNQNKLTISLYGGESLANKKRIRKILEDQKNLFPQPIKLNWILNTNGSLLTEDDVNFFKNQDVEIHLSIDGNEKTNDLSRTFHNGKSTFSTVIKSLKLIQKYKIRAQINSYLMPTNLNSLKEIVDIAHEHDIPQIYLDQFYSEQMIYSSDTFEKFQDVYFYSLSKNINLTGPWSRVKNNFNFQKSRELELSQTISLDINVNGSFYSSNLPKLKYNPIPFTHLTTYLNNHYEIDKNFQLQKYQRECHGCKIFSQCLGLAKEQVWYHINENVPTSSSCDFFINWISYLELPLYIYSNNKFDIISLFPREEIGQIIDDIQKIVAELENSLWKLNQKFSLRIVRDLAELKYASKQYLLPNWVRSTTNSNTLFHLSPKPSNGLKHEITHIFLNQKNFNFPQWAIEGFCEWINDPTINHEFNFQLPLSELTAAFEKMNDHLPPPQDRFYQSAKYFFHFLEKSVGREKMCQSLANQDKVDLNQWLISINQLGLEANYSNFQKFVW